MAKMDKTAEAAVALRLAGASYGEVADVLAFASPVEARDVVERRIASYGSVEDRDMLRSEEAARLERLIRALWGKAMDTENPEQINAARTVLAVIDRHSRLLGLDQPQEMVVYTPTTAEIDQWVQGMVEVSPLLQVEEADVAALPAGDDRATA